MHVSGPFPVLGLVAVSVVVVATLFPFGARAFSFELAPGMKRCFTDEFGRAIGPIRLTYSMPKSLSPFVTVTLTGPKGGKLYEKHPAPTTASELIETDLSGEHTVCFHSSAKQAFSTNLNEVRMDMRYDHEVERDLLAKEELKTMKKEQLVPLMNQAQYIEGAASVLLRDLEYLKEREVAMRDTNESTNTRTVLFTYLAVGVMVLTFALRQYKMRRFLVSKKILD